MTPLSPPRSNEGMSSKQYSYIGDWVDIEIPLFRANVILRTAPMDLGRRGLPAVHRGLSRGKCVYVRLVGLL